jgi:hypothetical protein
MLACFASRASSHCGVTERRTMAGFGPYSGSKTLSNCLWCTPQVLQAQIWDPSAYREILSGESPSRLLQVRQASRERTHIQRSRWICWARSKRRRAAELQIDLCLIETTSSSGTWNWSVFWRGFKSFYLLPSLFHTRKEFHVGLPMDACLTWSLLLFSDHGIVWASFFSDQALGGGNLMVHVGTGRK